MPADTTAAIRAQRLAALEQRVARLQGEARRVLEAHVAQLRTPTDGPGQGDDAGATAPARSPLRELLDPLADGAAARNTIYPELPALAEFRQLWSSLRADSQLEQSVASVPCDAGPLNSSALASRAIGLMRELSPGYLRSFLAYVDDLAWLERLGSASPSSGTTTPRKRASRKPRA